MQVMAPPTMTQKLHGLYQSWYYNGGKELECTYVNGILEGVHKTYYKNGRIREVKVFSNGKLNGLQSEYREDDGSLYRETFWKDDLRHGSFTLYPTDNDVYVIWFYYGIKCENEEDYLERGFIW